MDSYVYIQCSQYIYCVFLHPDKHAKFIYFLKKHLQINIWIPASFTSMFTTAVFLLSTSAGALPPPLID